MSTAAKKIIEDLLALPREERLVVLDALEASLDEGDLHADWVAEIERRIARVERGEARLLSWEEVEQKVAERLRRR